MHRRLKQPKEALKLFKEYPQFESRYPEISLLKALCLVEAGEVGPGVSLFEKSFVYVRGNLVTFENMTSLLRRQNASEERARLYRLLPRIDDDNTDALLLASGFEIEIGEFQAALELADKALSLEGDNVAASAHKARALYGLGKRGEALKIFENNAKAGEFIVDYNYYYNG